jgi:hypothetical protein
MQANGSTILKSTIDYMSGQPSDQSREQAIDILNHAIEECFAAEATATDSYSKVLHQIQQLQEIQASNPCSSQASLDASDKLQPLFARMAAITARIA